MRSRFVFVALACLTVSMASVHGAFRSSQRSPLSAFYLAAQIKQPPVGAASAIPPPDRAIRINVDNSTPQVGQNVAITVTFPRGFERCGSQNQLSFGDNESTAIGAGLLYHQYGKEGRYFLTIEQITLTLGRNSGVFDIRLAKLCSGLQPPKRRTINVQPPLPTPTPVNVPSPKPSPTPFAPSPSLSPPVTASFSPSPTPTGFSTPGPTPNTFKSPGEGSGNPNGTGGSFSSPTPKSGGGISWRDFQKNWWYLLLVVPIVPFVGYRALKRGFTPRPRATLYSDPGKATVNEGSQPLSINARVVLRPGIDAGRYEILSEGRLVKNIRRYHV